MPTRLAHIFSHDDPVVREVLDVWTPRFLTGGIPIGDLVATIERVRTWEDWTPAWTTTASKHAARAEGLSAAGRMDAAADAHLLASRCHHLAYFVSTRDPNAHRRGLARMLAAHDLALPHLRPAVEKLEFVADGTRCVGLLSQPASPGPHPLILLLPGLDSTKETRHAGRSKWIARGAAVMTIDGPGQGEASQWSVVRPDYEVVVSAAIDFCERHPGLDAGRVGVVGASLSGYYAPRAPHSNRGSPRPWRTAVRSIGARVGINCRRSPEKLSSTTPVAPISRPPVTELPSSRWQVSASGSRRR